MRKLKAAVVGVGNIGTIHTEIYSSLENVDLTAVCDIDQEKADKAATNSTARHFIVLNHCWLRCQWKSLVFVQGRRKRRRSLSANGATSRSRNTCSWRKTYLQ